VGLIDAIGMMGTIIFRRGARVPKAQSAQDVQDLQDLQDKNVI
jgi:hypothetical protein